MPRPKTAGRAAHESTEKYSNFQFPRIRFVPKSRGCRPLVNLSRGKTGRLLCESLLDHFKQQQLQRCAQMVGETEVAAYIAACSLSRFQRPTVSPEPGSAPLIPCDSRVRIDRLGQQYLEQLKTVTLNTWHVMKGQEANLSLGLIPGESYMAYLQSLLTDDKELKTGNDHSPTGDGEYNSQNFGCRSRRRDTLSVNRVLLPARQALSVLCGFHQEYLGCSVTSTWQVYRNLRSWWRAHRRGIARVRSIITHKAHSCRLARVYVRRMQGVVGDLSGCYESISHEGLSDAIDRFPLPECINRLRIYRRIVTPGGCLQGNKSSRFSIKSPDIRIPFFQMSALNCYSAQGAGRPCSERFYDTNVSPVADSACDLVNYSKMHAPPGSLQSFGSLDEVGVPAMAPGMLPRLGVLLLPQRDNGSVAMARRVRQLLLRGTGAGGCVFIAPQCRYSLVTGDEARATLQYFLKMHTVLPPRRSTTYCCDQDPDGPKPSFIQRQGIPQGSCLSGLLCALFYAQKDRHPALQKLLRGRLPFGRLRVSVNRQSKGVAQADFNCATQRKAKEGATQKRANSVLSGNATLKRRVGQLPFNPSHFEVLWSSSSTCSTRRPCRHVYIMGGAFVFEICKTAPHCDLVFNSPANGIPLHMPRAECVEGKETNFALSGGLPVNPTKKVRGNSIYSLASRNRSKSPTSLLMPCGLEQDCSAYERSGSSSSESPHILTGCLYDWQTLQQSEELCPALWRLIRRISSVRLPSLLLRWVDDFVFAAVRPDIASLFLKLLVEDKIWGAPANTDKLMIAIDTKEPSWFFKGHGKKRQDFTGQIHVGVGGHPDALFEDSSLSYRNISRTSFLQQFCIGSNCEDASNNIDKRNVRSMQQQIRRFWRCSSRSSVVGAQCNVYHRSNKKGVPLDAGSISTRQENSAILSDACRDDAEKFLEFSQCEERRSFFWTGFSLTIPTAGARLECSLSRKKSGLRRQHCATMRNRCHKGFMNVSRLTRISFDQAAKGYLRTHIPFRVILCHFDCLGNGRKCAFRLSSCSTRKPVTA